MGSLDFNTSLFEHVEYLPPDKIFELTKLYIADADTRKVNLGQGTYKDEHGQPWILPSVQAAKESIRDANHEYLPILGLQAFRTLVTELVYGKQARLISEGKIATCQALSGTGALHLAGTFLRKALPPSTCVYITEPTWPNHRQVFESIGFRVHAFRWFDAKTGELDSPAILKRLEEATPGSIIILHASAHNPTGCDPSEEEWRQIGALVKSRGLFPLFDSAYLGMTSGDYARDAFAIRLFADALQLETVVCASFAKNMGLYGERVGHVSVVTSSPKAAQAVESQLAHLTRSEISNPPAYGARIAAAILSDDSLQRQWAHDLVTMSTRIAEMRQALYAGLKSRGTPGSWKHIVDQKGMFCILGLPLETVTRLREEHHIYMADSSRVSIAGLNTSNVDYVASATDTVVRRL